MIYFPDFYFKVNMLEIFYFPNLFLISVTSMYVSVFMYRGFEFHRFYFGKHVNLTCDLRNHCFVHCVIQCIGEIEANSNVQIKI